MHAHLFLSSSCCHCLSLSLFLSFSLVDYLTDPMLPFRLVLILFALRQSCPRLLVSPCYVCFLLFSSSCLSTLHFTHSGRRRRAVRSSVIFPCAPIFFLGSLFLFSFRCTIFFSCSPSFFMPSARVGFLFFVFFSFSCCLLCVLPP